MSLTHVADTGLLISSTDQLQFGDSGTYIYQSADGVLDLVSDTEIELTATTIDINGAVAMDGAITGGTNITISGELDAATLDISGNADIDGTLEADAITVDGTTLAEYIADTSGAMFSSNTESGITVTYQDGDNTVDLAVDAAQTGITSIYATDLIMGEDSQTAIDFGTANEIDFKADNAARLTLTSSALYPVTDNEIDLGTASLEFKDAFFDGTVTADAFAGPLTGDVTGNASGTALTVTQAAQSAITSLGTLTSLTVDDVAIDGKVITMTGSASDTAVFTAGTNGTLSIVTTDAAAAAANIQITADGTVDIDSAGVLTLDSGAAINIEPAAGSAILLDGTISIDAGVVTGATSITSTAFVGDVTGTSSKATVTDSTANTNFPVVFHNESDGLLDDTGALRYNPSTGELLVPKLTVAGTTTTADTVTMQAANAVIFEGATADAYETTLSIVDPTADHTQYLINQGGYIPVLAAATTTAISSTPAELNILDGVTSTAAELNILDGVTATAAEINVLDASLKENNSIWIGSDPSGTTDTASNSVAIGVTALDSITTGDNNTAVGYASLTANTTGTRNTAVGTSAGAAVTTGDDNTAVGYGAGDTISTGSDNTTIGSYSLTNNSTGASNTAVGYTALEANTTASNNVAVGYAALVANTTGAYNVAVGGLALDALSLIHI